MSSLIIEYKEYEIKIYMDEYPLNPRKEFDNIGKLVCFHNRYDLGDKTDLKASSFQGWQHLEKYLIDIEKAAVILPIYLMDHSGITIRTNTHDFRMADSVGWDWGQIGFIYLDRATILKEWGNKILTQKVRQKAIDYLLAEIEQYDDYLTGNVYGYNITKLDDDEILEGCGGFYGDYNKSGLLDDAKGCIDCMIAQTEKDKLANIFKSNPLN